MKYKDIIAPYINKIHQGNCVDVLKTFPDNIVDCCVTSPAYYGLRDYNTGYWKGGDPNCTHRRDSKKSEHTQTGHINFDEMNGVGDAIYKKVCKKCGAIRIDEQIGLEETPQEYINKLVDVFSEVYRILKPTGCLWLNLGTSYAQTIIESDEMILRDDLSREEIIYVLKELSNNV